MFQHLHKCGMLWNVDLQWGGRTFPSSSSVPETNPVVSDPLRCPSRWS
jgi:hypothetical protein